MQPVWYHLRSVPAARRRGVPLKIGTDSERLSGVANSKSAKKRIRVAEQRRARNRPYRSAARTFVKKAELAIRAGDQTVASTAVGDAISMLDRVAGKGIIHKNNAARRKSRLMAKFNKLGHTAAA